MMTMTIIFEGSIMMMIVYNIANDDDDDYDDHLWRQHCDGILSWAFALKRISHQELHIHIIIIIGIIIIVRRI